MQRSIKKNVSDLWQLLLRDRLRLTIFGSSADELHQLVLCSDLMLASVAAILTVDILFTKLAARLIKTICLRAAGRRLHSGGPVLQVLYVRVSAHAKRNQ